MKALSILFYFFAHHGAWAFFVLLLLGSGLSVWRQSVFYVIISFVLAIANVFTGQFVNALFLAKFGDQGTGIITLAEQTNSMLNDEYIWDYDVLMRTAEGKDVVTQFSTTTASLYPIRNSILIPGEGERFVVKYIPGFEKNIVVMVDESAYGKRIIASENMKPVLKAQRQYAASPDNEDFRKEYLEALQTYVTDPVNATDSLNINQLKLIILSLRK